MIVRGIAGAKCRPFQAGTMQLPMKIVVLVAATPSSPGLGGQPNGVLMFSRDEGVAATRCRNRIVP